MLHTVFGALHRHSPHAGCLALVRQLVLLQGLSPGFDAPVYFLLVFEASVQRVEPGVVRPRGRPHQFDQILPLLVGEAGDDAPVVVAAALGAVSVMGGHRGSPVVVGDGRAGPGGSVAGGIPFAAGLAAVDGFVQESGTGQSYAGNHLGQVYVLSLAGGVTVTQGGQGAHCPIHSAGIVQVRPSPTGRGHAGQAGQKGQSG